jgi:hypothetical protein
LYKLNCKNIKDLVVTEGSNLTCVPPLVHSPQDTKDSPNGSQSASNGRQSKQRLEKRRSAGSSELVGDDVTKKKKKKKKKGLEAVVKMLNVEVERILISPKLVGQLRRGIML